MTNEHFKSLLGRYQAKLDGRYSGFHEQQMSEDSMKVATYHVSIRTMVSHCKFMCNETKKFIEAGQVEKSMRWLGFLQGLLWCLGLFTLDDLKNHSRASQVEQD